MPDVTLRKIDHLRFFVGNARQSAYFYRNAFGFDVVGYAGLETKVKHEAGYVLKQGNITFVLTSPLSGQHPESNRLLQHGDRFCHGIAAGFYRNQLSLHLGWNHNLMQNGGGLLHCPC